VKRVNKLVQLSLAGMKYILAFLLMLFITGDAFAQSSNYIKGRVVNGETGTGIPNASVFISNTSKGSISNNAGEFELPDVPAGNYDLVVSCIGYETQVYSYKASQLPLKLRVQLAPKAEELQTVVVEPYEKDGWEKWGKFFIENFIGTSANAKNCSIKNYKALHFRNSKKRGQLTVTANEPLIIENKAMGYKIQYQLEGFSYGFSDHVLTYFGYALFDELNKKGASKRQLKNREKAYNGSIVHFMTSLYHNRLIEEGFEIKRLYRTPNLEKQRVKNMYVRSSPSNPVKDSAEYYERILHGPDMLETYGNSLLTTDSLVTKTDALNKYLFFNDYLYIVFKKAKEDNEYLEYIHEKREAYWRISVVFLLNRRAITIDEKGNYSMPQDFMSYGYWSWSEKISSILPLDYRAERD
jgi:hypothetical protein